MAGFVLCVYLGALVDARKLEKGCLESIYNNGGGYYISFLLMVRFHYVTHAGLKCMNFQFPLLSIFIFISYIPFIIFEELNLIESCYVLLVT